MSAPEKAVRQRPPYRFRCERCGRTFEADCEFCHIRLDPDSRRMLLACPACGGNAYEAGEPEPLQAE